MVPDLHVHDHPEARGVYTISDPVCITLCPPVCTSTQRQGEFTRSPSVYNPIPTCVHKHPKARGVYTITQGVAKTRCQYQPWSISSGPVQNTVLITSKLGLYHMQ